MADSIESFAYPETTLYAWTGNTSALVAYAQNINLTVERTLMRKVWFTATGVSYGKKTLFVQTDKKVSMSIGAMYAGNSFYKMLASGANISATLNMYASADDIESTITLQSAQMESFSLKGAEGSVWQQDIRIIAPDMTMVTRGPFLMTEDKYFLLLEDGGKISL
jgi:hypothetical protein